MPTKPHLTVGKHATNTYPVADMCLCVVRHIMQHSLTKPRTQLLLLCRKTQPNVEPDRPTVRHLRADVPDTRCEMTKLLSESGGSRT